MVFSCVYWPGDILTGFWFSVIKDQEYQIPHGQGEERAKVPATHTTADCLILTAGQCGQCWEGECFPYENTVGQAT